MAIGSGIGAQLGISVAETTFATAVTVTRFLEFNSENLQYQKKIVEGQGLRAGGQLPRSQRRIVTTTDVGGDFTLDLPTRGLGLLLSFAMGTAPAVVTTTTGVYAYTFTLADLIGKSFTAQVGVPEYGGTVIAKTISGAKVQAWELSVGRGGIAQGKFTLDGATFTTATALAVASFPTAATNNLFSFNQGAITVDAVAVANVQDFTLSVDNALKQDRFNLGGLGIKAEQIVAGFRKLTGKLTVEFTDTTLLTKFLADTAGALVLTFTGAVIALGTKELLTITLPAVKFDADTPNVSGPGVVDLAMTFTVYDDGTNQPLTILYQTADSAL